MSQEPEAQPDQTGIVAEATSSDRGKPDDSRSWLLTRWLFLRLLGLIYLMAFASYAVQVLALNGSHGILPIADVLNGVKEQMGAERFLIFPTVYWLNSSDQMLQFVTWGGAALSILAILGVATGPVLALCLVFWLSVVSGGGEFTEFQSDGMLIEATLLALFVVNWSSLIEPPWPVANRWRTQKPPSRIGIWLLRFMIFRLMFAAGVVKLTSHDPTWADLTAMQYHFWTQPLPTPLAWYCHLLPAIVLKGMVLAMFVSEIVAPWLMFGNRWMRYLSALLMAGLQVMIILTGNYTFLNYLMIVLCIPVLDDGATYRLLPKSLSGNILSLVDLKPVAKKTANALVTVCATVLFALAGLQLVDTIFTMPSIFRLPLFLVAPLHIADRYGLFAVMTTTRPEIEFEGSDDGKSWQPYVMRYKVDDVHQSPPWVAPHMPRLPWRLWFAAMVPPPVVTTDPAAAQAARMLGGEESEWVLSLVQRMLEGEPVVMGSFEKNPFQDHPARYIRAWVYQYHFTSAEEHSQTGDWWTRDEKREYLPPLSLENGQLKPVFEASKQP